MHIPRLMLSAIRSRTGKTTITIGLMRALANRGYKVQPYKVGPDFIDPSFHFFATGRHSRNLDSFMLSPNDIMESFQRNLGDADMAVIEGKMGLYDSHNAVDEKGSSAEISKLLKCPVVLIADVERMSRTVAPLLMGYRDFDPEVDIEGVILNRVGNPRHAGKARKAAEQLAKMNVFGVVPRQEVVIPDRHLGLIPAHERDEFETIFDKLASLVEQHVDIDEILKVAEKSPDLQEVDHNSLFKEEKSDIRIGILADRAFSFYYQDTIDAFASKGEIVFIDALKDKRLPEIDLLYIGGGFPEVFAQELENNKKLRERICEFCNSGKPVYGECGGLMYLGESILVDGGEYEMVGFLPLKTKMHQKFQAHGYSTYTAVKDNLLCKKGDTLLGHEFHYSEVIKTRAKDLDFAFKVKRGSGIDGYDGITLKNTLATYIHIHVLSYPEMIKNLLRTAKKVKDNG
ncbi:MAG: cobyrinate a,c-diamide synthase [Archaeoglobaceae archaeon]